MINMIAGWILPRDARRIVAWDRCSSSPLHSWLKCVTGRHRVIIRQSPKNSVVSTSGIAHGGFAVGTLTDCAERAALPAVHE
jgi:hypothetical protein